MTDRPTPTPTQAAVAVADLAAAAIGFVLPVAAVATDWPRFVAHVAPPPSAMPEPMFYAGLVALGVGFWLIAKIPIVRGLVIGAAAGVLLLAIVRVGIMALRGML